MYVSLVPPDPAAIAEVAIPWLHRILDEPRLSGAPPPESIRGYLYIGNTPKVITGGYWQITESQVILPRYSEGIPIHPLTKLAVLSAIAALTGATSDPDLVAKITSKLVMLLKEETMSTYASVVKSYRRPSRLAIDQDNFQIAAEMDGRWLLPSGAPIGVDEKWITMDF